LERLFGGKKVVINVGCFRLLSDDWWLTLSAIDGAALVPA
jgi:hypothetical protein